MHPEAKFRPIRLPRSAVSKRTRIGPFRPERPGLDGPIDRCRYYPMQAPGLIRGTASDLRRAPRPCMNPGHFIAHERASGGSAGAAVKESA